MKWTWWKILCILLLGWALIAGMLVPLRKGVMNVTPSQAKVGETINIRVEGYNTQWANASKAKAWLHIDSAYIKDKKEEIQVFAIESKGFKPIDERNIEFQFDIPAQLPLSTDMESASLLVDVEGNEQAIRPLAITITQVDTMQANLGKSLWNAPMNINRTWKFEYPYRNILYETIRNTYYHVPMWFVMFTLFGVSVFHAIQYLRKKNLEYDTASAAYTQTGVLFGLLGLFSGALWATYTWGEPFPLDIKIIMTYTCLAIYLAYFILRASFENPEQKARISAVYSIFAFASLIPLLYVVPKLSPDSLHPGNGGNPAFGTQDMDNTMRMVFYPASIGWILLGLWIASLVKRYWLVREKYLMNLD